MSLIVTIKLTKEISVLTIYLFRMVAYICCVVYHNILWLYVYYTIVYQLVEVFENLVVMSDFRSPFDICNVLALAALYFSTHALP